MADKLAAVQAVFFIALLCSASVMDLIKRIVPNWICLWIAFISIIGFIPVKLLGIFIALPFLVAAIFCGGMGGGDIKLAALLGILYGPYGVLFILAAASLSALAFQALERFFYYRKWNTLPFAPFLFLGSIIAVSLQCRF